MKLVLATRNQDKAREIQDILSGIGVDLVTMAAFPDAPETVEDGDTLEENALKKAREARDYTGLSALADDTGLEVDALGGAPGVYAARYSGPGATYESNCAKLLSELEGVPDQERTARFRTVMVLALAAGDKVEDGDALVTEGILHGTIATQGRGAGGFGYDPLFVSTEHGTTLAEMSPEQKNSSSHRYRALVEMRELLLRLGLAKPAKPEK